jgi:ABC-type lipoprotein release transport system permease subunit
LYRLILAFRYLRARKITYFSIVGVAVGVMALIVVLSVMEGFQRDFKGRIRGMLSDIMLRYRGDEPIETVLGKIESVDHVLGAAPRLRGMGLLGGRGTGAVATVGIDPEREVKVSELASFVMNAWIERPTAQAVLFLESYHYMVKDKLAQIEMLASKTESPGEEERRETEKIRLFGDQVKENIRVLRDQTGFSAVRDAYQRFRCSIHDSGLFGEEDVERIDEELDGHLKDLEAREDLYDESVEKARSEGAPPLPFSSPRAREVILGEELAARHLNTLVGEKVQMVAGSGRGLPTGELDRAEGEFTVVGTFKSGMYKYDSRVVFMPLLTAQEFQGREGLVSEIGIRLDDFANAGEVKARLKELFPGEDIRTWAEHRRALLQAIRLEKAFLAVILFMIVVVAGFNMLATFLMMVSEKTRDLGILKALGGKPEGITSVFLLTCTLIGVIGAGIGTAAGLAIAFNANEIEAFAVSLGIPPPFPRDLYYLESIPVVVEGGQIFWIVAPTILFSVLLGGVIPALKASRLNPLDALRHE